MEDSLEQFIKLTRNTKESHTRKPRKQDIILAHKKRECESRAAKVVEFLIEGKLRCEVFLRCLKHINQAYYQDVVEERAISKICGYSLCGNQLPTMPTKQFFIDSKCNKVYDLTERKNYCSNFCYRASLHIKLQIDDSPLWVRNINDSPKFNLLANTERGSPGEEVNQGIAKPVKEPSFVSVSSFAKVTLEDIRNDEIKSRNKNYHRFDKKQTLQTLDEQDELSQSAKSIEPSQTIPYNDDTLKQMDKSPHLVNAYDSQMTKSQKHSKTKKDFKKIFANIKKYVHEWMTLETYIFLFGEELLKNRIDGNRLEQHFANLRLTESSITQQKKYTEICKKLHLNQLVEDSFDKSVLGFKINPVPNYNQLKEESHNLELKVCSFYSGDLYDIDEVKAKDRYTNDTTQQTEDGPSDTPAVLPLVDVNSQNAFRRKIYLNSISKAMLALTKGLHIPSEHILDELNLLVKTFKLQAHNIIFEPFLWSIIALILIKMLSIRNDNLERQLNSKHSTMFIKAILNQLPNAETFFLELFNDIKNIDLFLEQYYHSNEN